MIPAHFHPRLVALLEQHDPAKFAEFTKVINLERHELEREVYEDSFLEFFKRAWREIESNELKLNWHHLNIIQALEDITYGNIRNLIINVPPRHSKSRIVNIFYPAWVWCRRERDFLSGPQVKFFCVSYSSALAEEHALYTMWLLQGEWYQSLWGDRVKIRDDLASRAIFGNTNGGERISNSIEGGLIGRGGDIQVIDDPLDVKKADSQIERENTLRAFSEGLSTRITDPKKFARVLIMQRLHHEDVTEWALEHWPSDTVHLFYPAKFDPGRACASDPRTREGELLWPDVWGQEQLAEMEIELGPFGWAGQFQQLPSPREGGIIGRTDWNVYPEEPPDPASIRVTDMGELLLELPPVSCVVLFLDTAMSERETADWNACVVWGVWHRRRNLIGNMVGSERPWFAGRWSSVMDAEQTLQQVIEDDDQPRAIMMEAWRRRCKLNDETPDRMGKPSGLVQRVIDTARRRKADWIVIENKTLGKAVADEIKRQMQGEEFRIHMFEPGKYGDKVARLHSVQPLYSQGLVYAPGKYEMATDATGRTYTEVREEYLWVETVIKEVSAVPRGKNDDLADGVSGGLIFLRENGYLQLTKQFIQESVRTRMARPPQQSVAREYGVM